ncbi:patatin-like phospholipase family protein [Mycolicibacter minnesotensis]
MTTRRALAVGCGGTLGFAWTVVALAEVQRALDWDARTAEVLVGTSAGSEVVAALGSGRTPAALLEALDGIPGADPILARRVAIDPGLVPPIPKVGLPALGLAAAGLRSRSVLTALAGMLPRGRGDLTFLREYGDALADPDSRWVTHAATWIVASDARSGCRVAFGAPGAPTAGLGDAVAASWTIPGWFPPSHVAGRTFIDGGAVSSVSADLLLGQDLDEVVVIAPMASEGGAPGKGATRLERLLRRQMTRGLDREVGALRSAGVKVIRIEPGSVELAAMGANFMNNRRRSATLEAARSQAPARIAAAIAAANRPSRNAR